VKSLPIEAVVMPESVGRGLLTHARNEAPLECCGLLIGTKEQVVRSARARNICQSPTRYRVDPVDHFEAIRTARNEGLEVVGAYHSHPASLPRPSETDLSQANYPHFVYVIVSLVSKETEAIRGYRLRSGQATQVELLSHEDSRRTVNIRGDGNR
jgi:proteasome lid subunit RPN8/RPN11